MVREASSNVNPGDSRLPVCEEWMPKLQEDGQRWLIELARWYESNWHLALNGAPQPSADSVIELIAPDRKDLLRKIFRSIDSRYQSLVPEFDKTEEVTVQPSRAGELPGSEYEALDLTVDFEPDSVLDSTRAQGGTVNEPLDSSTKVERTVRHGRDDEFYLQETPKIPGYRIGDVLGRGGMGVVYLAHQESIDRQVALKMILPRIQVDQVALDRFYAEVKAIGRFQNENIVRIHDAGEHQGMPYFSLEYVEGKSLAEQLEGQPMDSDDAARLLETLARAMQVAHDAGVIHRDLKPANVLMTRDGVPKITDFGLAKEFDGDSELSRDGSVIGTPSFMSPEQAKGLRDVGPRSDVYGLGALLYSLLTGRPPFQGSKANDTLMQVINIEPVEPIRLQPSIPKDLDTICLKCLQKDPSQRYADARSLAEDLTRFLKGEPIAARPVGRPERVWRWCKRNPMIATVASVAALLGMIVMIGGPVSAAVIYEQKQEVTTAKVEAEKNATLADSRADEAIEAKEVAMKFGRDAALLEQLHFGVLRNLVFDFNKKMAGNTNLVGLREELIETVRNGLLRLEGNRNTERSRDMLGATAHFRLGEINLEIGRSEQAIQDFKQCESIFLEMERTGALSNRSNNLSKLYRFLGDAYRAQGDATMAQSYYERSLELRRDWDKRMDTASTKSYLAESLSKLGSLEKYKGNMVRSRELLEEAAELYAKIMERNASDGNQEMLLHANRVLAKAIFQEGNTQAGLNDLGNVANRYRERAEAAPGNTHLQVNSATFHTDLAVMQLYLERPEEAVVTYQYAISQLSSLFEDNRDDAFIRDALSYAYYGLLVARKEAGHEDNEETTSQMIRLRRDALKVDPNSVIAQGNLAIALARAGHLEEGYRLTAETLKKIGPTDPAQYVVGGAFAQLARVRQELERASQPVPEAVPPIEELQQAAIEAIRNELENGFSRVTDIRLDPDLDPIRDLDAYQTLLNELEEKLGKKGASSTPD